MAHPGHARERFALLGRDDVSMAGQGVGGSLEEFQVLASQDLTSRKRMCLKESLVLSMGSVSATMCCGASKGERLLDTRMSYSYSEVSLTTLVQPQPEITISGTHKYYAPPTHISKEPFAKIGFCCGAKYRQVL